MEVVSSIDIRFCQNLLGHVWAREKFKRLVVEYSHWNTSIDDFKQRQKFLLQKTNKKPFLTIKDIKGNYRLIDDHHGFFSFYFFMKDQAEHFELYIDVETNFQSLNPSSKQPWTENEMMKSLIENRRLFIEKNTSPTFNDLNSIPSHIEHIQNAPERTIVSRIFEDFDLPMKGYDFVPFIQFLVKQQIEFLNLKIDPEAATCNIKLVDAKKILLNSKEILQFLIDNISKKTSAQRQRDVKDFLTNQLNLIS